MKLFKKRLAEFNRGLLCFSLPVLTLLAAAVPARAEVIARGGPERVSLLELYTSEGCSSCPPAEEWMSGLRQKPGLWKEVVPVAFHVDYWDYLGWKDVYAERAFSDRQRRYGSRWQSRNIYTPGFVLNGQENRGNPLSGLPQERGGVLFVEKEGGSYRIAFEPAGEEGPFTAYAALLGFDIVSQVKDGENAGRRLVHDFTVLDFKDRAMAAKDGRHETTVELQPGRVAADASLGIAVWVTREDELEPLQAAGNYF